MSPSQRGRFVTFEGIEGAGKSTQMDRLVKRLADAGEPVVVTREPGGTALGEKLRGLLLDPDIGQMAAETELLLIFAARAEHLAQVIRPRLEQGAWVLCDRFTDASFAYQGAGRGLGCDRVATLETWLQGELRPDLVMILDVPVEIGLQRALARGKRDRIENEDVAFFERARGAYLERARSFPDRYRVIDGAQDLAAVSTAVARVWDEWRQAQDR
jgi:dTMP kinase